MFSLVLDTTNKIIRAVMAAPAATNNPQFSSHYADNDGTTFVEGSEGGELNGTTSVTLVTAPAASTRRIVKSIALYNADTAAVTVDINWFDGTNASTIANVTLNVGDTWTLEGTFNSSGALKNTSATAPGGSNTQVQFNDGGVLAGDAGLTYVKATDALTVAGKVVTPFVDAVGSAGGALRNASGTAQAQWGAGGGNNVSLDVATNINPANANVSIAPTGTGSLTINPATAGTLNNLVIGGTTPLAATFTDVTLNAQGDLRFADANSSNWVAFQGAANITSNVTWTLPAVDGSANQFLQTDGSGTLTWATGGGGGGTPGGSTTQVQYNNAGSFGGITNATTDGTTLSMTSPKIITGINDVNGNELLYLVATASAVNELNLANAATGNAPSLTATGGDANVGIALTPKGTGRTTVTQLTTTSPRVLTAINDTNGNELIGITATASAVNEITVANAATTANPVISATGGDTNIGITLTPKGTGGVTTANCFAVGGATPSTSGAGITFPATQSASTDANTLDDYEEGTFTPTITASGGGSPTYSNQTGIYTKIGRAVSVYLYVGFSKNTLTGNIKINGLPFTIGSGSAINNCQYWYIPGGTNIYSLLAFSGGSNTALDLYKIIAATIDNSGSSFTAADINSAAYLHFNFVYYV